MPNSLTANLGSTLERKANPFPPLAVRRLKNQRSPGFGQPAEKKKIQVLPRVGYRNPLKRNSWLLHLENLVFLLLSWKLKVNRILGKKHHTNPTIRHGNADPVPVVVPMPYPFSASQKQVPAVQVWVVAYSFMFIFVSSGRFVFAPTDEFVENLAKILSIQFEVGPSFFAWPDSVPKQNHLNEQWTQNNKMTYSKERIVSYRSAFLYRIDIFEFVLTFPLSVELR